MKPLMGSRLLRKSAPAIVLAAALLMAYAPAVFGASGGINSESPTPLPGDFAERGCTSCHGGPDHLWAPAPDQVTYNITLDGEEITSGQYEAEQTYTLTITLHDELNPDAGNRAGFYLSASAGSFQDAGDENVQITGGNLEASHSNPSATQWQVDWTAPADGAVAFMLLVNDVDGDGTPNIDDHVYRKYFALTDESGAQLGAAEDHEEHFGVALPQYWLGLIALASMVFVILFSFVYLKFVSPHNTDQKDR